MFSGHVFANQFLARYGEAFGLKDAFRTKPLREEKEAPSMGLLPEGKPPFPDPAPVPDLLSPDPTPVRAGTEPETKPDRTRATGEHRSMSAAEIMSGGPAARLDVQELHEAYKLHMKLPHRRFRGGFDVDAKILAECIEAHGLADCLLVAKHASDDGMVSGRDDERKVPHPKISYIFGNEDTFSRILAAARRAHVTGGMSVREKMERAAGR
jgi:hypothetical protein